MASSIKNIVIILVLILYNNPIATEANPTCMIISNGSQLKHINIGEEATLIDSMVLENPELRNITWPLYSYSTSDLFFEAYSNGKSGIYKIEMLNISKKPELLYYGKYPSLSPDESAIAYINEQNMTVITDISTGNTEFVHKSINKPSIWKRPTWLNNTELIYISEKDEVSVFNRKERSHCILFVEKLLPLASKKDLVLFTNHKANTIYKYKSGKLSVVRKTFFFTIGPAAVIINDNFLYSRQTWQKLFSFSEEKSTFQYSIKINKDVRLIIDSSLFGSAIIPCAN